MLGFTHPRPPSRKEVAMQVVKQERKTIATHELRVDPPGAPVAAPPPDAVPVCFAASCTLAEFCSLLRDHLDFLARHDSPAGRRRKWMWPLAFGLLAGAACAFACLPFMTRVWIALIARAPACQVRIDAGGIERRAGGRRSLRGWDEVRAIRRYRNGYLLLLARGAIPVPFRCISAEQEVRLRAFCAGRTHG